MAWSRKRTYTRSGNKDGARLYAPGVSRMSEADLETFARGFVESTLPGKKGVHTLLAQLRGESVQRRRETEKDMMLLESGAKLREIIAGVILDGTLPGWEKDEVGYTIIGRAQTQTEKTYEVVTEGLDVASGGLVDLGDEGGVDDVAIDIWNAVTNPS